MCVLQKAYVRAQNLKMTSCDLLSYYNHIEVPLELCFAPSSILSHLDIGTFALIWNQKKKKMEKKLPQVFGHIAMFPGSTMPHFSLGNRVSSGPLSGGNMNEYKCTNASSSMFVKSHVAFILRSRQGAVRVFKTKYLLLHFMKM